MTEDEPEDHAEQQHERNVKASEALLKRLLRFHGEKPTRRPVRLPKRSMKG